MEDKVIKKNIEEYLKEKYNESFNLIKLQAMFDGNRGPFIRVLAKSINDHEIFEIDIFFYPQEDCEEVLFDKEKLYIKNGYELILLQNEYEKNLQKELKNINSVRCMLRISGCKSGRPEIINHEKGIDVYLGNPDYITTMYIYVLCEKQYIDENYTIVKNNLILNKSFTQAGFVAKVQSF